MVRAAHYQNWKSSLQQILTLILAKLTPVIQIFKFYQGLPQSQS